MHFHGQFFIKRQDHTVYGSVKYSSYVNLMLLTVILGFMLTLLDECDFSFQLVSPDATA